MKKTYCILFFTILSIVNLHSQSYKEVPLDSLFKTLRYAFDLTQQNRVADAMTIANDILEVGKTTSNDTLIAFSHNVLGAAHSTMKNDSVALKHFNISKDIYIKIKDESKLQVALNNIGVIYRHLENFDKAIEFYEEAGKIAEKNDNKTQMIYTNYNVGYTKLISGSNPEEALKYVLKAQHYANTNDDVIRIKADILEAIGECYYKAKKYNLAEKAFNQAIKFSKENNFVKVLNNVYELKSEMLTDLGRLEESNNILFELSSVRESIDEMDKYNAIKNLEAKYAANESEEILRTVENEKELQFLTIKKARSYNVLLLLLSIVLLLAGYWIIVKNKQLKLAKEKAESLSKAKSEFYSEISHELRTPLYAVVELSSILSKENQNKAHQNYLESLKFSGNHLLSLVNNVLEINKLEAGMMKMQYQDFNLKVLISNIINSLEYALSDSNNTIKIDLDPEIPIMLSGDSSKLSQILLNLIANATKFTKNGNITIAVKLEKQSKSKVVLNFEVTDDGLGISKENLEKIHANFYQQSPTEDSTYAGTGLGLSVVKSMLFFMLSELEIESELGKGSTFKFQLKFKKNSEQKEAEAQYNNALKTIKKANILVVDDNKINQMVTQKVLKQLNLKSKVVDNGFDAIKMVKDEKFDCILMDLHMPEIDGYQTTQEIRKFNKDIAIVALTAATNAEIENKIDECFMDNFIIKPFAVNDLVDVLSKAISKNKLQSV